MLITFKSAAAADVVMFGDSAKALLKVIGKDPEDATGIVTVDQLPFAIETLKSAIDYDKARHSAGHHADDEDTPKGLAATVHLAQRAWPLLEMLEFSQQEGKPVTWGV